MSTFSREVPIRLKRATAKGNNNNKLYGTSGDSAEACLLLKLPHLVPVLLVLVHTVCMYEITWMNMLASESTLTEGVSAASNEVHT